LILILNFTACIRYDVAKSEAFKNDIGVVKNLYKRLALFLKG